MTKVFAAAAFSARWGHKDLHFEGPVWNTGAIDLSLNVEALTSAIVQLADALGGEIEARGLLEARVTAADARAEQAAQQAAEAKAAAAALGCAASVGTIGDAGGNANGVSCGDSVGAGSAFQLELLTARRDITRLEGVLAYQKALQEQRDKSFEDSVRLQMDALRRDLDGRARATDLAQQKERLLEAEDNLSRLHAVVDTLREATGVRQRLLEGRLDELAKEGRETAGQLDELSLRCSKASAQLGKSHTPRSVVGPLPFDEEAFSPRSGRTTASGTSIISTGAEGTEDTEAARQLLESRAESRMESRPGSRADSLLGSRRNVLPPIRRTCVDSVGDGSADTMIASCNARLVEAQQHTASGNVDFVAWVRSQFDALRAELAAATRHQSEIAERATTPPGGVSEAAASANGSVVEGATSAVCEVSAAAGGNDGADGTGGSDGRGSGSEDARAEVAALRKEMMLKIDRLRRDVFSSPWPTDGAGIATSATAREVQGAEGGGNHTGAPKLEHQPHHGDGTFSGPVGDLAHGGVGAVDGNLREQSDRENGRLIAPNEADAAALARLRAEISGFASQRELGHIRAELDARLHALEAAAAAGRAAGACSQAAVTTAVADDSVASVVTPGAWLEETLRWLRSELELLRSEVRAASPLHRASGSGVAAKATTVADLLPLLRLGLEPWLAEREAMLLQRLGDADARLEGSAQPASEGSPSRERLNLFEARLTALEHGSSRPEKSSVDGDAGLRHVRDQLENLNRRLCDVERAQAVMGRGLEADSKDGSRADRFPDRRIEDLALEVANLYKAVSGVQKGTDRNSSKLEDAAKAISNIQARVEATLPLVRKALLEILAQGAEGAEGARAPVGGDAGALLAFLGAPDGRPLDAPFASKDAHDALRRDMQHIEGELQSRLGGMREELLGLVRAKANVDDLQTLSARQRGLEVAAARFQMVAGAMHIHGDTCTESPALTKVPLLPARCISCDRKVEVQAARPNPWQAGGLPAAPWPQRDMGCPAHRAAGPPPGYRQRRESSLPALER